MQRIGTGSSLSRSALEAGREAARRALDASGGDRVDFTLVFASAAHDQTEVLRGVREVTGEAPLSGCSTSGIITREGWDESTHTAAVMTIASDAITCRARLVQGLASRAHRCAAELGRWIRDCHGGRLLLLFADGLVGNVTDFLSALESELPAPIPIVGGAAGDLLKLQRTFQYCDGRAVSDAVSAVLIDGDVVPEISVSQGSDPIGIEQTVTRSEAGWVYEIDGQSAWSIYRQYLDEDLPALTMSQTCYICLAVRLPEPDPFYGDYLIRCPLRLDEEKGALFFPGNIPVGTKVHMALRSAERTIARAQTSAQQIVARHSDQAPLLVLHFDCCCRGHLMFGARTNPSCFEPLRGVFGPRTPWFGFCTYGEIAPIGDRPTSFHNYSAVLCALYPPVGAR